VALTGFLTDDTNVGYKVVDKQEMDPSHKVAWLGLITFWSY
jgi:hypothetical protein